MRRLPNPKNLGLKPDQIYRHFPFFARASSLPAQRSLPARRSSFVSFFIPISLDQNSPYSFETCMDCCDLMHPTVPCMHSLKIWITVFGVG